MFGAGTSLLQNQVLGPLSYLVSQSSSGVITGSRSALASSSIHSSKQSVSKTRNLELDANSTQNTTKASQEPDILAILNSFECRSSFTPYGKTSEPYDHEKVNKDSNNCTSNSSNIRSNVISSQSRAYSIKAVCKFLNSGPLPSSSSESVMQVYGSRLMNSLIPGDLLQISTPRQLCQLIRDACDGMRRTRDTAWHVSHVSSSSFLLNKHIGMFNSSSLLKLQLQIEPLSRGFKTIRSIEKDQSPHVSVRDRLRAKAAQQATAQPTDSPRLKTLLVEEGNESSQKQLKMAFAEGYLAADGGTRKPPASRMMRFVKNFQNILGIIVLIAILMSAMSTMGIRMNVINGSSNEVQPEEISVTFDDIRGVEESKQELQEIVEFLKCPEKFTSLGAELPKGVLLVGPPGTGKTLLARAVAGEAGVPFFHAAGPEFDEILVGQGARRVRDLFRAAKSRAPCVIFIDEIDSVGAKRTNSVLHPYANQTVNQLLAEMDGFHKNEGVIVLGATNRRDDLDKALLRPGRFDVEVQVPVPDLAGRLDIFNYYLAKVKIGTDVEVQVMARGTTGFTGADIKNVVNQAALRAAADLVDSVTMKHLESARDKVLMGPEKKSRIPDEEVNVVTAYHEGGHTLVAHYTEHSHPLHKVTIIPRGPSLGHTAYIPAKEQYNVTRAQMLAMLDSLMGGRAAEELIFGPEMITAGASSDLKQATSVATHMVKDYGMSDRVGLRTFEDHSGQFLGGGDPLSTSTKEAIDGEIKRLLSESYERARAILRTHAKEHKALAEALLKYETLDADDIKAILDGRPVSKDA